jgi:Mrp family chromosome partitioning ATPase
MGRMIDILRTADHRPAAVDAVPMHTTPAEIGSQESGIRSQKSEDRLLARIAEPPTVPLEPPVLEDHDDVPFIEVGGPREPTLRLVPAPDERNVTPQPLSPQGKGKDEEKNLTPLPPSRHGKGEEDAESSPPFPVGKVGTEGVLSCSSAPALFTIRFEPVHATRLFGRGPVVELIAFHQPDHTISNQYRSLAAEIDRQLPGAVPRVLLFAAGAESIGASTVVLNLAMTLARKEARITVVDAHLARPALAARLGLADGPGLREVLAGQTPAAWCLQETAHPNLFAMSAGGKGERRDGFDLTGVVDLLRGRSDYVLFDAGPWYETGVVNELATRSDAVYLVLDHDAATTTATAQLQHAILTQTGRLRGCVLTQR